MTLDLPKQQAALEQARAEIETALGADENWRALQRPAGDDGPDRSERDARLVKALEANPLYGAWKQLGDAIDALRDADRSGKSAQTGDDLARIRDLRALRAEGATGAGVTIYPKVAAWGARDVANRAGVVDLRARQIAASEHSDPHDMRAFARSELETGATAEALDGDLDGANATDHADIRDDDLELPQSIRDRIRAEAVPDTESTETGARLDRAAPASAMADARKPASGLEDIAHVEPLPAAIDAGFAERLHKLEADMDAFDEAVDSPEAADDRPEELSEAAPVTDATMVAKVAPTAAAVAAKVSLPASGSRRDTQIHTKPVPPMSKPAEAKVTFVTGKRPEPTKSTPAEVDAKPEAAPMGFVVPTAAAEEAEVNIVKPDSAAAAPVKRFIKALSGE